MNNSAPKHTNPQDKIKSLKMAACGRVDIQEHCAKPNKCTKHIKGTIAQDCSTSGFFHESTPYEPLIHTVKYSRIRFQIRGDIWICICISAVVYSPDSNFN
jgi:hypothetical protein